MLRLRPQELGRKVPNSTARVDVHPVAPTPIQVSLLSLAHQHLLIIFQTVLVALSWLGRNSSLILCEIFFYPNA